MRLILTAALAATCLTAPAAAAPRDWVAANQTKILAEYVDLLKIPNVASDTPNIRRNADRLVAMMQARGLSPRLLEHGDPKVPPAVYGEWKVPGAKRTLVLYAHYDGQPVTPEDWKSTAPFEPKLLSGRFDRGGQPVAAGGKLDPDWRIYGRSASDDKAGVMAILAAVDALRAEGKRPTFNLKIFFEGEEEDGSEHLGAILAKHRDVLKSDGWVIFDGPAHQTGAKQVVLGVRGIVGADITVYGPTRPLHSGHYGNWAPNPAMLLSQLLASMKDRTGRVTVAGFYDDVTPLTASERAAIAAVPNGDTALKTDLGLGWTEGDGRPLIETLHEPSLNVDGIRSADVLDKARNVVPPVATATVDMRLVAGNDHQRQFDKLVAHVRSQGFYVTANEPTAEERHTHKWIARVAKQGGYNAERTPLDHPLARDVAAAARSVQPSAVVLPSLGGSLPLYILRETLRTPSVTLSLANHDNNQHGEDENLRLGNLWDAIEMAAAVMTMGEGRAR